MVKCAVAVTAGLLAGCDNLTANHRTNPFSGDEFPILVDDSSGAILVGLREAGKPALRTAVLDAMSPITLIDRGADVAPSIFETDLTVLGARFLGGELDLPRGVFTEKQVVTLHPCQAQECSVGTNVGPRPFDALIGLDAFKSDALRLRLDTDEIFILPDIAGDDQRRGRACDAVFDTPFRGGGTLLIGGTEVGFTNWRIAIDACLKPNPERLIAQSGRGADVLLVFSSAIGTTLLSASAYERYRQVDPAALPPEMLPEAQVILPSGPVTGNLTDIPSIALVGNSSGNPRAPCRQMWASHLLGERNCAAGDDCPCTGGDRFCSVPAMVEVAPAVPIPVLVVADSEPTLQALRTELRPDRPEVDGILGTYAIAALELDIDYAHDRLLARCVDRTHCGARVAFTNATERRVMNDCLGDMPGPIVLDDN